MRERLYRLLVGRIPGIRDRYIRVRKEYKRRLQAFLYLLWLNIQYYLFFRRSLKTPVGCAVYEEIPLFQHAPESSRTWTESLSLIHISMRFQLHGGSPVLPGKKLFDTFWRWLDREPL